jgi:signal-transduction protein with cAMP-binding, CBS, and nucleotidyltransferase domain
MELKKQIVKHFEQFIPVSGKLTAELLNRVSVIYYKKGGLIIDANRIGDKSYFILEGLTRTYSLKDGKEVIEYFSSKNEWANSPRSWRTGKPDIYYADAIEDTSALCIKAEDMHFLFNNFPELDRYGRLSMITLLDHLIERIRSFRFTTASEKYLHFKNTYPTIYHRIPLGMVASYLGIAQETLSRLRAKKDFLT